MRVFLFVIFFFVFFNQNLFAQSAEKNEMEKRVPKSEFHQKAFGFIEIQLSDAKKVKYYLEVDGLDTSYEIKFFKNQHHFSVEFNNNGVFEDVEMKVDFKELPAKVVNEIRRYLVENYKKHKIRKVQVQYKNKKVTSSDLEKLFEGKTDLYETSYEIEIAVKNADGKPAMYEFHFDVDGNFVDKRIFKQQGDDNILY